MTVRIEAAAYGAEALDALRRTVAELKSADPMRSVTILAPNNVAGIVARRYLAAGADGYRGIAGIEVTTLPRLADRLAAPTLAPRRPATRAVTAAAWRRALAESPGVFSTIADHPATVRALANAHTELRDLSQAGRAAVKSTGDVAADLVALHTTVADRLREAWYDATDVLTAATERAPERSAVVLYLPQRLSNFALRFVEALANTTDLTVIAGRSGVKRADQAIEASLAKLGPIPDANRKPPTATRVLNASDSDDEVRCIVREVVETLKATPAHRVAVLYAARAPYARLLHEHFAAADIVVNGPGVRPADERAASRVLLETLALADHDVPRAALFQALATAPTRDFASRRIPTSRWERTSRSAGVVAGDDWATRLDAYVTARTAGAEVQAASEDPPAWLAERLKRDIDTANALREFVCRLRDELHAAQLMSTWRELAAWCLELFTALVGDEKALAQLPREEQYAAATIITTLRSLTGLDQLEQSASFDTLRDVLSVELAGTLPRVGRFGEGVFVAPISAAIGLDVDVVYVCGLSEALYPGRVRADALLPDRARQATNGELPASRERIDAKHRALLAAFTAARVESVASFPRGDLRRSTRLLPSRFLLPTLRELSHNKDLAATEWHKPTTYDGHLTTAKSFAGELLQTARLATGQEWRTRQAAATKTLEDDVVTAAIAMVRARASAEFTRFDGNLIGVTGLPNYAVDQRAVSPTALEAYAGCPHGYFVGRLLGVKPIEQPEDIVTISPWDIGSLIHESAEALVNDFADSLPSHGAPWTSAQRDRYVEIVEAKATDYQQRGLTGHPRLWAGERTRIISDALWLLADDNEWRATANAAVAASELTFGMHGEPPVAIPIPGGRMLMRGSADRIDLGADGTIYVTDIKTGSNSRFKQIERDDPFVAGTKLQLPVYAYAARARFGDSTTPVVASYWFVRKTRGRIRIELSPALEQVYAGTLAVLVRSIAAGLFPPRPPEAQDYGGYVSCEYCNPDGIGYTDKRERWERKRLTPELSELVDLIEPDPVNGGAGP